MSILHSQYWSTLCHLLLGGIGAASYTAAIFVQTVFGGRSFLIAVFLAPALAAVTYIHLRPTLVRIIATATILAALLSLAVDGRGRLPVPISVAQGSFALLDRDVVPVCLATSEGCEPVARLSIDELVWSFAAQWVLWLMWVSGIHMLYSRKRENSRSAPVDQSKE